MKKIKLLCCVLAALMLLSACSAEPQNNLLNFYFLPAASDETFAVFTEKDLTDYSGTGVKEIMDVLCTSEADYNRFSAIPSGTELLDYSIENNLLTLNFSGEYSALSGIRLTEANACIVLTFCQLPDVDSVSVTAEGESMMPDGPMCADDLILSAIEDQSDEIDLLLYLPDLRSRSIYTESTQVSITEDSSASAAVLAALCNASGQSEQGFLPESSADIMLWTDESICYVNLNQEWKDFLELDSDLLQLKLICIVDTLAELDGIEYVQFLLDGAAIDDWSSIGADFPIAPDDTLVQAE